MPVTKSIKRSTSRGTTRGRSFRRTRTKADNAWVKWVVGFLVGIPLIFALKLLGKSEDDADVKQQMVTVVQSLPSYPGHKSYYLQLIDRCHPAAFNDSYSMGGRHRAASINARQYLLEISQDMASIAKKDGQKEVAEDLTDLHDSVAITAPK